MKNLLLSVALMIVSISSYAQEKDVTKFLGIPIDGTKSEMIAKLKGKGFTQVNYDQNIILEGEFNGREVYIFVVTNNRKVYRIMVADKNRISETDIKIRFNILCQQFSNNDKYLSLGDHTIPENEDISNKILLGKRYQASYYQVDKEFIAKSLLGKYTKEQLENTDSLNIEDQIYIAEAYQNGSAHKQVWFMITEDLGKYYISIYYDNVLNMANGDDL